MNRFAFKCTKCDYCNCQLTPANNGGYAPHGLPLYVCKACYQKLKDSKIISQEEVENEEIEEVRLSSN